MKMTTIINRYEELRNRVKEFVIKKYELHKIQSDYVNFLIEYVIVDDEDNVHTLVRVVEITDELISDVIGVYPCQFPLSEYEEYASTGNVVNQSSIEEFETNPYEDDEEQETEDELIEDEEPIDKIITGH